ncbi:hypothetical protein [Rhizobium phaseoli]|uniref:hypothetical protein n=1 Tax=Rhizobium phaseoli TaxID=396 RepID=UPI00143836DB|nr:hypothetical protein [Rhizobium phaseoli]MDK4728767.1 hypothetical protein [Rhizobium phaseoli]NKE86849.1 hypothetical protein [Rhizobium phaseoli]
MPNLVALGEAFEAMGCGTSVIDDRARMSEAMTGKPADKQKILKECYELAQYRESLTQEQIRKDQIHNRLLLLELVGAVVAVLVLLVVLGRPIRRALEAAFINSAARAVKGRRDIADYKDDLGRRIREKADS